MTPRSSIIRWDMSLSYGEFSTMANRKKFIGHRVLRPAPVQLQAADFLRVRIQDLMGPVEDTRRKAKSGYNRETFEFDQQAYATEDHGAEEIVDDRQVAQYAQVIKAEYMARERAINRVLQRYEYDVAAAVFDTATWTGTALTAAASVAWTTPASAVPITDIDTAIEKVTENCGSKPNSLVCTDWAFKKLCRTNQVQDLLKYSGHQDPKGIPNSVAAIADLLQLENIILGSGWYNIADKTADTSGNPPRLARLWDPTMAMVCHVSDNEDYEAPEPTIGRTFMWTAENGSIPGSEGEEVGVIVEEYREEGRRGGVIRARNDRQVKIFHKEAGFLITGVAALPAGTPSGSLEPT
jgi:hypothetical protein